MLQVKSDWARAHALIAARLRTRTESAGLALPTLPPVRPRSALARVAARLREGRLRRLNPATLAWNAARDRRSLAMFVTAMVRERY